MLCDADVPTRPVAGESRHLLGCGGVAIHAPFLKTVWRTDSCGPVPGRFNNLASDWVRQLDSLVKRKPGCSRPGVHRGRQAHALYIPSRNVDPVLLCEHRGVAVLRIHHLAARVARNLEATLRKKCRHCVFVPREFIAAVARELTLSTRSDSL